jgi:hypothetical protein
VCDEVVWDIFPGKVVSFFGRLCLGGFWNCFPGLSSVVCFGVVGSRVGA